MRVAAEVGKIKIDIVFSCNDEMGNASSASE
jgi:hypothetical protein